MAMTAAETGHLVFGTLHTTGAVKTIDRIIDALPVEEREQTKSFLARACSPSSPRSWSNRRCTRPARIVRDHGD